MSLHLSLLTCLSLTILFHLIVVCYYLEYISLLIYFQSSKPGHSYCILLSSLEVAGPFREPCASRSYVQRAALFIILKMSPLLVLFSVHCVCWRLTFSYLTMQWLPLQAIAYWRLRCWQVMSSVKICSKNLYLKHDPFCYLFPVYILWKVSMLKFR